MTFKPNRLYFKHYIGPHTHCKVLRMKTTFTSFCGVCEIAIVPNVPENVILAGNCLKTIVMCCMHIKLQLRNISQYCFAGLMGDLVG